MPDESDPLNPPSSPAPSGGAYSIGEKIAKINVADEIKNSFLDYSMSVIISRALPDVRDGLKPSQRRILYAMHELSLFPGRKHYKCAKICGDTSGNYHPHGEAVIYPTLVHMAQAWAMREKLIDGKGNFGSVENDPPAAMRYTEARLTHLGAALMSDMDKDTVDFVPNYDERMTEPKVFPAAFPNLLVNGGTGIAVGMATNMAPHNLAEVIDAICAQIDTPEITNAQLQKFIKGPDFPTGGIICGIEGIKNYFETGKGSIKLRGKVGIEQMKGNREQLIITEIPFNVNRAALEEQIADLVNNKIVTDISGVRNESDENCRLVIELKRDAIPKVVINNLFKHTQLEVSFSVNALSIHQGKPKTLTVRELIAAYIDHRREVVLRRTRFELRRPRSAPNCSKATSAPSTTSTSSSASSAARRTATRPRSSCSPSSGPAARSSAGASSSAATNGSAPPAAMRSPNARSTPSSSSASTSSPGWRSTRCAPSTVNWSRRSRTCSTSSPRNRA